MKYIHQRFLEFFEDFSLYGFSMLFFLFLLPVLILRENAYFIVHDNLDSQVALRAVLAASNTLFNSDALIMQIMNGLPRSMVGNTLNITTFLYSIFPSSTAYLSNYFLIHIIAFVGMYLLISKHFEVNNKIISSGVAFCFGVLPFYSIFGLSIAGLPLLVYAILNIIGQKSRITDYFIIFIFALYSYLSLVGLFIITSLFVWFVIDWIIHKHPNLKFAYPIVILSITYMIVEYNLIEGILYGNKYVSNRTEFAYQSIAIPWRQAVTKTGSFFLSGQYHASSLHKYILILIVPLAFIIATFNKRRKELVIITSILFINLVLATIAGFQDWDQLIPIKSTINLLYMFQFGRFHFLHPLTWYILFAISLGMVYRFRFKVFNGRYLVCILILFQGFYILTHNKEFMGSVRILVNNENNIDETKNTIAGFYSEDLFHEINEYIGKSKNSYRVVSIGIHPAISAYNGFYTLDFYTENYPLSYKHHFREIIAGELEKSKRWRDYFDGWGNRCYVFSSELNDFMTTKQQEAKIKDFQFNTQSFKNMGGEYIFSAVEILNSNENMLQLERIFTNDNSPWRIFLYRAL